MEQSVAFSLRCLASVSTTTSPMITESRPFTFEGANLIGTLTSTVKAARKVQVPLRVILAERDTITPAAQVRRALRDASNVDIQSFPDTHFELFAETREAVMGLTVDGLAQHPPAQCPE